MIPLQGTRNFKENCNMERTLTCIASSPPRDRTYQMKQCANGINDGLASGSSGDPGGLMTPKSGITYIGIGLGNA